MPHHHNWTMFNSMSNVSINKHNLFIPWDFSIVVLLSGPVVFINYVRRGRKMRQCKLFRCLLCKQTTSGCPRAQPKPDADANIERWTMAGLMRCARWCWRLLRLLVMKASLKLLKHCCVLFVGASKVLRSSENFGWTRNRRELYFIS